MNHYYTDLAIYIVGVLKSRYPNKTIYDMGGDLANKLKFDWADKGCLANTIAIVNNTCIDDDTLFRALKILREDPDYSSVLKSYNEELSKKT